MSTPARFDRTADTGGRVSNITSTGSAGGTWASALVAGAAASDAVDHPERRETPTAQPIHYAELPLSQVQPNPRQPRSVFDEDALDELADSMSLIGLLQPIVVRAVPHQAVDNAAEHQPEPHYEIVAGERRFRCALNLGWDTIPAMVRPTRDTDLLRDALLENLHRAALNPLEEAAAYQQLLTDFGCTQEELAQRVGRSRPQIANTIRLLRLPPAVQRRLAAGVLSQGHARALLSLPDEARMESLATRIVAEGLSVRMVEEIVAVDDGRDSHGRRRPRRPRPVRDADGLSELAESLADRLDTRVQVTMGRTKGRVTIEFAGREDLDRILGILDGEGTPT